MVVIGVELNASLDAGSVSVPRLLNVCFSRAFLMRYTGNGGITARLFGRKGAFGSSVAIAFFLSCILAMYAVHAENCAACLWSSLPLSAVLDLSFNAGLLISWRKHGLPLPNNGPHLAPGRFFQPGQMLHEVWGRFCMACGGNVV